LPYVSTHEALRRVTRSDASSGKTLLKIGNPVTVAVDDVAQFSSSPAGATKMWNQIQST